MFAEAFQHRGQVETMCIVEGFAYCIKSDEPLSNVRHGVRVFHDQFGCDLCSHLSDNGLVFADHFSDPSCGCISDEVNLLPLHIDQYEHQV